MISVDLKTQGALLKNAYQQGRLSHAYMLSGIAGLGKTALARAFGAFLLCEKPIAAEACQQCRRCQQFFSDQHPDFMMIVPEEKAQAIKIDQMRKLSDQLSRTAYAGGYRIVVIAPADTMPVAAANALLKTLEEPQGKTLIFLIDHQTQQLPKTILSRCQKLFFYPEAATQSSAIVDAGLYQKVFQHMEQILLRRGDPLTLAGEWAKLSLAVTLNVIMTVVIDLSKAYCNQTMKPRERALVEMLTFTQWQDFLALVVEKKQYVARGINLNAQLCLESVFIGFSQLAG